MQNKIRQINDSIHGTIYISDLEYQMISTPYFYRLHDVYQSSTVYMTFPSNRTKRYEHSIGTMELAGQMFYSAVTNALPEDRKALMDALSDQLLAMFKAITDRSKMSDIPLYSGAADELAKLLPRSKQYDPQALYNLEAQISKQSPLKDYALCRQEVNFFDLAKRENDDKNTMQTVSWYSFLYQCTLEALRIAALFHDIGHPPFSHIIEQTLKKIKSTSADRTNIQKDKLATFNRCINHVYSFQEQNKLLLDTKGSATAGNDLHEVIGQQILYNAYQGILHQSVKSWATDSSAENQFKAIYLVTVIEFTFAILLDKCSVFSSLHRLIDGVIDVDRLDYIVRDAKNTGVNWGSIPYGRIISAVRLIRDDNQFAIAFPEKVCEDIDDILVDRYKIFQRINYHHKSVKTSMLLQKSVEFLAEDYLISPLGCEITPEIKILWTALDKGFGRDEKENQIAQWTDSWLISVLNGALIKLNDPTQLNGLINTNIGRTQNKLKYLLNMLEEVQLNRKHYYSLFRRQQDALLLRDRIIQRAQLTEENLNKLSSHEYNKLLGAHNTSTDTTQDSGKSALESLRRLSVLQEKILDCANFGLLDIFFPSEKCCEECIIDVLEKRKAENIIVDYFISPNAGLDKLGVNNTSVIHLYRRNGENYRYDVANTLLKKLTAQRADSLWMFAYVCLPDMPEGDADNQMKIIFEDVATAIGDNLHNVMNELFNFDSIIAS